MSDDENEIIDEEDDRLTDMLMEACTPYGDERWNELGGSGVGLMNFGTLYSTRAELTICLEQKMNYIKAATLLTAAKFRFNLISDATWSRDAFASIKQLHSSMLRNAGREDKADTIFETIDAVKRRLIHLRETQSKELDKIEMIDDKVSLKEEIRLQKKKIENVKSLLEKNTADYTVLMYYIASKCEYILGDAPCKFALVGLGSLAKGEVTLYSGFNYAIVLEDGVRHRKDNNELLNYFRWFAVVFQVIIIGLEETLVTSLGVVGLEEFSDVYTPSGIAIDGMMPLVTELHTAHLVPVTSMMSPVEFIKPVSEMVPLWRLCKYTDIGFSMKNLLRNFCHIYGSKEVFDEFSEPAYENIFRHFTIPADGTVVASFNMGEMLRVSPFLDFSLPNMSKDSSFYLPMSICLSYISSVFRWKSHSGFGIIASMKNFSSDLGVVCGRKPKCHRIELALAAACLIRMRFYAIGNGSRLKTVGRSIFNFVEEKTLRIVVQQVWHLSRHLNGIRNYAVHGKISDLKPSKINTDIGKNLESALKDQLNILETNKNLNQHDKVYILHNCLHTVLRLLNINSRHRDVAAMDKAKRYLLRHPGSIENQTATSLLLTIYLEQCKFDDALRIAERHVLRCKFGDRANTLRLRKYQMSALLLSRSPDEVVLYCDKALETFKDPAAQIVFSYARIISRADDAGKRRDLIDLVDLTVKENARYLKVKDMLFFLEEVFTYQYTHKWFEDAILTIEVAYLMLESKVQVFAAFEFYRIVGGEPAQCYLQILPYVKDTFKAVKMLSRVLSICKTANFREDCHSCFMNALLYLHDKYQKKPVKYVRRLIDQYLEVIPEPLKSISFMKEIIQSYETKDTTASEPHLPELALDGIPKLSVEVEPSQKSQAKKRLSDMIRSVSHTHKPGCNGILMPSVVVEPSEKTKTKGRLPVTTGSTRPESILNVVSKPTAEVAPPEKHKTKGRLPVTTGSSRPESTLNVVSKSTAEVVPPEKHKTKGRLPVTTASSRPESTLNVVSKFIAEVVPPEKLKTKGKLPVTTGSGPPQSKVNGVSEPFARAKPSKKYGRYDEIFGKSASKNVTEANSLNLKQSAQDIAQYDNARSEQYETALKNSIATKSLCSSRNMVTIAQFGDAGCKSSESSKKSSADQSEIRSEDSQNAESPANEKSLHFEEKVNPGSVKKDSCHNESKSEHTAKYDSTNIHQETAESHGVNKTIFNAECGNDNDLIRGDSEVKESTQPISDELNNGNGLNQCTKNVVRRDNEAKLSKESVVNGSRTYKFNPKNSTFIKDDMSRLSIGKVTSIDSNVTEIITANGLSKNAGKRKADLDPELNHINAGSFGKAEAVNEIYSFKNLSETSGTAGNNNVKSTSQNTESQVLKLFTANCNHSPEAPTTGSETETCSTLSEDYVSPYACDSTSTDTGAVSSYSSRSSSESADGVTPAISHNDARRRLRSSSDESQPIPKVASFKIEVKITRVGKKTNVHLVVRDSNQHNTADNGYKSESGEGR